MCFCCPPAISALFCLWVQSGFSKGTVAGALTFFPPDPPLYKFQRRDEEGNLIIEWPEIAKKYLPEPDLKIKIEIDKFSEKRNLIIYSQEPIEI